MATRPSAGGDSRVEDQLVRGYYSVLRWRLDATRDEARNVAVLLVDERGRFGGIRHVAVSSISPRLREQGIVDDVLLGLEEQVSAGMRLRDLKNLHETLQGSIVITEPEPVAVGELDDTLDALYRALVAPRPGGGRVPTKGILIDRVIGALRMHGVKAQRGVYIDDFIFDVVVQNGGTRSVLEVLSFAAPRKDWTPIERDAAHFLYALSHVDAEGRAVVQPPADLAPAASSFKRVLRWFDDEGVPTLSPEELTDSQLALDIAHT